jgi:hypothetical protein
MNVSLWAGPEPGATSRCAGGEDEFVQSQGFALELDREVVGIAVRVSGGFVFFSSDRRFERFDGQLFPRTRAILQRLQDFECGTRVSAGKEN